MIINVQNKEMIMKKTYISPNMKIVALRAHKLCAVSGGEGLGYGGTTNGKVTEAGSRSSFWDDEDD